MIVLAMIVIEVRGAGVFQNDFAPFLEQWLDPHWVALLRYLMTDVQRFKLSDLSVTLPAICLTALGAGSIAGHLRLSIRSIWGMPGAESGMRSFFVQKGWSILLPVLLASWIMLGTSIRIAMRKALGIPFGQELSLPGKALELVWSTLYWTPAIAFLLKSLAPVRLRWRQVFPGALLTSSLMFAGRYVVSHHLLSKYGGSRAELVGDVFAFLLLAYYFSQVFLLGAELTRVLTERRGAGSPAGERGERSYESNQRTYAGSRGPRSAARSSA
jgi:membrane protein